MERCCSISNVKLHEEVIQVTVIRPNARSTPTLLLALCCPPADSEEEALLFAGLP